MPVPTSKEELLTALSTTLEKLVRDLEQVPEDRARDSTMPGHAKGTTMSPADLVSYLIGWNELVLKWLDHDDQGQPVDFPDTGYRWNQLGQLAQRFYSDYSTLSWPDLLTRLVEAGNRLAATIEARTNEELYGRPWYDGKWTKGRMIQLNSSSPYSNARSRIRKWLREQ
ncbi:ClbS/DfsB family four-helix bundle protein [Kiloniella sp. b19]|uniref:ClbS/DfsB family four-helix bundle protein n=1 Tax=Kiloniella sp. GXU_MW_B19 TaxID=3141326 RepID=UPI0031D9B59B